MLPQHGFYRLLLVILPALLATQMQAQSTDFWHRGGYGLWMGIQHRYESKKHWAWQSDLQLRCRNSKSIYDYTLVRTGLYRQQKNGLQLGIGLVYGRNDVQNKTKPVWVNEYRIFQDIRWNIPSKTSWKPGLQFRLEQRWFNLDEPNQTVGHSFALRYRARFDLRKEMGTHWRVLAGNEIMYQQLQGQTRFNQYRVSAGAAYHLTTVEFQLLLMQMIVDARDQSILRLNFLF